MYLSVWGNKSFLTAGLPIDDQNRSGLVDYMSFLTLHNVCALHRGGGRGEGGKGKGGSGERCTVKRGISSTPAGYHDYSGGYHEYTEGCSVHWGDIMSTAWGYHDKCGRGSLGKQLNLYGNPSVLNIPRCTHDAPSVLNIRRCTAQTFCRVFLSGV